MFLKKKTSDEEAAENLRQAADAFNKAYLDCKSKGLSVGLRDNGVSTYTSIWGTIKVEYITRTNREEY